MTVPTEGPGAGGWLLQATGWAALAGVGAAVVLAVMVLAMGAAAAAPAGDDTPVRGGLRLQGGHCCASAPLLDTDVEMAIKGIVAQVTVTQRFRNPTRHWQEAVYTFPLPQNAAVDRLRMRIGDRVVHGVIKERAQARRTYGAARRAGRRAGLVEQQRSNIFTASVANIGPGQQVSIRIRYRQVLHYRDGHFSIRFPMVVAPRYIPGAPVGGSGQGTGWASPTDQVPDAGRITPPVRPPSAGAANPVHLYVDLQAGFPLASVESPYHDIRLDRSRPGHVQVSLAGPVPADRDFQLIWTPRLGAAPQAAVLTDAGPDGDYALLMVMPPAARFGDRVRASRDLELVIDTSGSMAGLSLEQAKAALALALDQLGPHDRFNVIQFNSVTQRLFAQPVTASAERIAEAKAYVRSLTANGGTEMAPALTAALSADDDGGGVRQVVFLTDGAVGDEDRLFALIRRRLGHSRLFTVGIGSAPNSHFMTRAARIGRGTFTYIGRVQEVRAKMDALFAELQHPVLTDVKVNWPTAVQAAPDPVPDLYMGEPLVIAARAPRLAGVVDIQGAIGGQPWHRRLTLPAAGPGGAIGALWARRRIAGLMDRLHTGADAKTIRQAVVRLGLVHQLVTRYTSLVAVDPTPVRPAESTLKRKAVPVNLPAGWQYGKVFGKLPQTATTAPLHMLMGALLAVLALAAFALRRVRS